MSTPSFMKKPTKSYSPYVSKPTTSTSPTFSRTATPVGSGSVRPPAAAAPAPSYRAPSSGGGGSFSSFAAPAVAAPPPRPSLREFIDNDFSYRQAQDEYGDSGRRMAEFDAESDRMKGEVERDQAVRREDLDSDLKTESLDTANDFAARGLLRSGGIFTAQDEINRGGAQRRSAIDDLLSSFLSERGSARVSQLQQNRQAINDRINAITQQYQSQYGI